MTGSLRSKVVSGLVWTNVGTWSIKLFSLLLFAVLARLLEPAQFGLFAAVTVVMSFVEILAEQGLGDAVVQRRDITTQQLNAVFFLNLLIASLIFMTLWLGAPYIANELMKVPELVPYLQANSVVVILNALGFTQSAMHRRKFEFRRLAVIGISSTVASGLLGLGLAWGGFGVWALVAQAVASSVIVCAMLWRRSQWQLSTVVDLQGLRDLFRFSLHWMGAHLLDFGGNRYIEIYIVAALGSTQLGFYMVGTRLYLALMQVLSNANRHVAFSAFAQLSSDKPALCEAYYKTCKVTAATAIPAFVMLGALAPELTRVVFGVQWEVSAQVALPMALFGALQILCYYNGTAFNAIGKPSVLMWLSGVRLVLTLGAFHLIAPKSLGDIVYLYMAVQFSTIPVMYWLLRGDMGLSIRRWVSSIQAFVAAAGLGFAAVWLLRQIGDVAGLPVVLRLIVLGVGGTATIALSLLVFGRGATREVIAMVTGRGAKGAA